MKYEFASFSIEPRMSCPWSFVGAGGQCAYEREITERAAAGWRFTGWFPLEVNGAGVPVSINLVFERDGDG